MVFIWYLATIVPRFIDTGKEKFFLVLFVVFVLFCFSLFVLIGKILRAVFLSFSLDSVLIKQKKKIKKEKKRRRRRKRMRRRRR